MTSENLALTPVLTKITSAQLTKADLLELVEAEEEARLRGLLLALDNEKASIDEAFDKYKDQIAAGKNPQWKKKVDRIAKTLGAMTPKNFETSVHYYEGWTDFPFKGSTIERCRVSEDGKKLEHLCILKVRAVYSTEDSTFKIEYEENLGENPQLAAMVKRIEEIKKEREEVGHCIHNLSRQMKSISAAITRKALESNELGKEVLTLLNKLRGTALHQIKAA